MRKLLRYFFLILLFLLLATCQTAMAEEPGEIKIYFKNKQITSDVAPFIENNRTMIPVRMIAENMGYDVLWNPSNRKVTVLSTQQRIVLTIDKNVAMVGGDRVTMDTPAMIRNDRTFVPVRFISENFGYQVDWDNDTRSVLITKPDPTPTPTPKPTPTPTPKPTPSVSPKPNAGVSDENVFHGTVDESDDITITKIFTERNNNTLYLKIQATGGRIESPATMELDNPIRFVLDIADAKLEMSTRELNVGSEYISKVRFSQYTKEPNSVRIVVDLNKQTNVDYGYVDGFFTLSLKDSPSEIKRISAQKTPNTDTIIISSNTVLTPEYFVLYNPYRIVFDFYNTQCGAESFNFQGNYIEKVQFYEHPEKTRLTITAEENAAYEFKADGTNFQISVSEPLLPQVTPKPGINGEQYQKVIVLDPGHGGTEPGTIGEIDGEIAVKEKDINLKISNRVLKILRDKGYNVIATRTNDTYVGLTTRADIANSANADLFVSIHNNSFGDPSAQGTLTMYAYDDPKDGNNISGKTIAQIMQKELVKGTEGQNRGLLKNSQIVVIRKTEMPAILVECLFMSNEEDLRQLMDDSRIDKIAEHIAQGIENICIKMVEVDKTPRQIPEPSPSPTPTATP